MVLLIIIPFLNGYLFGNTPYFQTNPFLSWGNDSNDSFFLGIAHGKAVMMPYDAHKVLSLVLDGVGGVDAVLGPVVSLRNVSNSCINSLNPEISCHLQGNR